MHNCDVQDNTTAFPAAWIDAHIADATAMGKPVRQPIAPLHLL